MKRISTIIISALLALIAVTQFASAALITTDDATANDDSQYQIFSDVDSQHWAFPYLREGSGYGFLSSGAVDASAEEFRCNEFANRAEAVKMFALAYEIGDASGTPASSFSDVSQDDWFYNYVFALAEIDVVSGYQDETFRPAENINRAEVAQIAYKLLRNSFSEDREYDESLPDGLQTFTDVQADDWFYTPVEMLVEASVLGGYEDNTFRPDQEITRCELAKVIAVGSAMTEINNALTQVGEDLTEDLVDYLAETYGAMSDEELLAELELADDESIDEMIATFIQYGYEDLAGRIESLR